MSLGIADFFGARRALGLRGMTLGIGNAYHVDPYEWLSPRSPEFNSISVVPAKERR